MTLPDTILFIVLLAVGLISALGTWGATIPDERAGNAVLTILAFAACVILVVA